MSSDELAEETGFRRGTMVHHLDKMIKRGSAMHHEGQRKLRGRISVDTVEEIRRDLGSIFEDIRKVSESDDQTADLSLR